MRCTNVNFRIKDFTSDDWNEATYVDGYVAFQSSITTTSTPAAASKDANSNTQVDVDDGDKENANPVAPNETEMSAVINGYMAFLDNLHAIQRQYVAILNQMVKASSETFEVSVTNRLKKFPDGKYKVYASHFEHSRRKRSRAT